MEAKRKEEILCWQVATYERVVERQRRDVCQSNEHHTRSVRLGGNADVTSGSIAAPSYH